MLHGTNLQKNSKRFKISNDKVIKEVDLSNLLALPNFMLSTERVDSDEN